MLVKTQEVKSYLGGCTPYFSEDRKYTISMRDKEKKRILTDYSINTSGVRNKEKCLTLLF